MSYNYTPLKQSADRLIQRFGQTYTFTRTTKGSYDPATGTTTDTTATYQKSGILFDYFDGDSAGQTVLAGDRRLLAEARRVVVSSGFRVPKPFEDWVTPKNTG